ncbi:MAG: hypothetical protein K2I64_00725 [Muribaculaceae bacterium]|nr:hypothetical protein [Muribaculaceae bacterium]
MNCIKSLTLSIADISEIFAINDPIVREQAISIIQSAASDPENINTDHYKDCHPIIQKLIQKLKHRVELSRRSAEARARRKAEEAARKTEESALKADETSKSRPLTTDEKQLVREITLRIPTEPRRIYIPAGIALPFHWLDENIDFFVRGMEGVFRTMMSYDPSTTTTCTAATEALHAMRDYLQPYIESARQYKDL